MPQIRNLLTFDVTSFILKAQTKLLTLNFKIMNIFLDISTAVLALICGVMYALSTNEQANFKFSAKCMKLAGKVTFTIALLCGFITAGMESNIFASTSHINDWLAIGFVTAVSCSILAGIGYICTYPRKSWREFTTCETELLRVIKLCLAISFIVFLAIFAINLFIMILQGICIILAVLLSALAAVILDFIVLLAIMVCAGIIVGAKYIVKQHHKQ